MANVEDTVADIEDVAKTALSKLAEFEIDETNCSEKMIDIGMNTNSEYFIATIQDVMNLNEEFRTNIPGKNDGNWMGNRITVSLNCPRTIRCEGRPKRTSKL